MKKYSNLIALTAIIPVLLAIMYSAGLNYYQGYLRSFGISFDIFNLEFNQIIYFGFCWACIIIAKILSYGFFIYTLYLIHCKIITKFSPKPVFLKKIAEEIDGFKIFLSVNKITNSLVLFIPIIWLMLVCFWFIISSASEKGEYFGISSKKQYERDFKNLTNKNINCFKSLFNIKFSDGFEIGYVLATNQNFMAIYSKDHGLIIKNRSMFVNMTSYRQISC